MLLAALLALALQAGAVSDPAGRYAAQSEAVRCVLVLGEPGRRAPGSLITPDAISGLAFAQPGCALALADAGLWRLERDETGEERLSLFDLSGAVVWSGEAADRGWRGVTADGEAVTLRRG